MSKVIIFSDGASRGNGSVDSIGAYGGIVQCGEYKKEISKAFKGVTNNQMELRGVIESLKILDNSCEVEVFSDSKYVCDAFNKNWIDGWKKKGWKTASKKPVANRELWEELIKLTNIHNVKFTWVKGHSTNEGNQRADELCNLAMDNYEEFQIEEAIEYENQMFDSEGSFFTYDLFQSSRKLKKALLPRNKTELLGNKRVQRLQKKEGVIRILSCDADILGGIYTVAEMIPMKGYFMRKICYMEAHNGKTASEQVMRIRRLVNDFDIDTCVLDVMTIGLPVLDLLGTELVDEETGEEYRPICAYNDEELKARCRVSTAIPMIFGMRANAQLNSDMIVEMKSLYQQGRVEMLISESEAEEFLSKTNKEYANSDIGDQKNFYELPYINTTLAINECIQLETIYKMGRISIKEKWNKLSINEQNRKNKFTTSLLYLLWVSTIIETEKQRLKSDLYDFMGMIKNILSQTDDSKLESVRLDMIQSIEGLVRIEKEYAKLGIR